jgi:hypothetical protein
MNEAETRAEQPSRRPRILLCIANQQLTNAAHAKIARIEVESAKSG